MSHYNIQFHSNDLDDQNVLVCPLNWGLGHASRCIPLIESLQAGGYSVMMATSGAALDLLRTRFPELPWINFPDYNIRVPRDGGLIWRLIFRLPHLFHYISKEHQRLQRLIEEHKIDIVISDNRYGLHTRKAHCIFITHQLMVKCPPIFRFAEGLLHRFILRYIRKFDVCLIPDSEGPINLSGDLAHRFPLPSNAQFIGLMSRFTLPQQPPLIEKTPAFEILAILSGPEPQRSYAEQKIMTAMIASGKKCGLIQGIPSPERCHVSDNITVYNHAGDALMATLIKQAGLIVCRPGYSTLMDLMVLKKSALLIPTPGQTEQGYLAHLMKERSWFSSIAQQQLTTEILQLAFTTAEEPHSWPTAKLFNTMAVHNFLTKKDSHASG